eukprot:313924-Amphidinium_carterae.1
MFQQQTQQLNHRLGVAEQRAVAAELNAATMQAGAGRAQMQARTLVDTRNLGKTKRVQEHSF